MNEPRRNHARELEDAADGESRAVERIRGAMPDEVRVSLDAALARGATVRLWDHWTLEVDLSRLGYFVAMAVADWLLEAGWLDRDKGFYRWNQAVRQAGEKDGPRIGRLVGEAKEGTR